MGRGWLKWREKLTSEISSSFIFNGKKNSSPLMCNLHKDKVKKKESRVRKVRVLHRICAEKLYNKTLDRWFKWNWNNDILNIVWPQTVEISPFVMPSTSSLQNRIGNGANSEQQKTTSNHQQQRREKKPWSGLILLQNILWHSLDFFFPFRYCTCPTMLGCYAILDMS